MFGEMGLKLSTSTVNDWIHATANILYPLYQCQRKAVMQGGYVQIEENLKNQGATADQILQERQRLAVPILDGLEAWMHAALMTCTPQDPLAKAIKYALPLWPRIKRYTEDGNYHIDNNPVEQGQRSTVLGRKNYLFSQNDRGAQDNAIFYTFIISCHNLGINPYHWLKHTLEHIDLDMDDSQLA